MNQRERAIAITAGVAIGALALNQIFIDPLLARADEANARAQIAQDELDAADSIAQNRLRAKRNWKEMSGGTVPSDYQSAEGQLVNLIPAWASRAGMNLTSITPERSENEEGFGKITLRAAGTGDLESVGRFLYEVQIADVPVRVSDVSITARSEGEDDLAIQLGISTIYSLPADAEANAERMR